MFIDRKNILMWLKCEQNVPSLLSKAKTKIKAWLKPRFTSWYIPGIVFLRDIWKGASSNSPTNEGEINQFFYPFILNIHLSQTLRSTQLGSQVQYLSKFIQMFANCRQGKSSSFHVTALCTGEEEEEDEKHFQSFSRKFLISASQALLSDNFWLLKVKMKTYARFKHKCTGTQK